MSLLGEVGGEVLGDLLVVEFPAYPRLRSDVYPAVLEIQRLG